MRFPIRLALRHVLLVAGQVSALACIPTVEARASLGDRQHHRIAFSKDTDSLVSGLYVDLADDLSLCDLDDCVLEYAFAIREGTGDAESGTAGA